MSMPRILRARFLLQEAGALLEGGALLLREGKIERVLRSQAEIARAHGHGVVLEDLGAGVLTAGLVNAHSHLDLSALEGCIAPGTPFLPWIAALLSLKAGLSEARQRQAARHAAQRLLETGTTSTGDIDSSGWSWSELRASGLRLRSYREVLDADDPRRTPIVLERLDLPWPADPELAPGWSPHTPHTASDRLLLRVAERAREQDCPIAIHWSESQEEVDWLREGRGPFAALLARSPGCSGLERLRRAGLLGPKTTLIHGNLPEAGEPEAIAQAGSCLVHCPGSHAYFEREVFPLDTYIRAGVNVALGSDSLASNLTLDMRREMQLLRRSHPGLSPDWVWQAATSNGARALGFEQSVGRLRAGWQADLAYFSTSAGAGPEIMEELTAGLPEVLGAWVCGRRLFLP